MRKKSYGFTKREATVSINNVCSWLDPSSWHCLTLLDISLTFQRKFLALNAANKSLKMPPGFTRGAVAVGSWEVLSASLPFWHEQGGEESLTQLLSSPFPRMQPGLQGVHSTTALGAAALHQGRASNGNGTIGRQPRSLSAHALPFSCSARELFWLQKTSFWLLARRELILSKFVSQAQSLELAEALHFRCQLLMI